MMKLKRQKPPRDVAARFTVVRLPGGVGVLRHWFTRTRDEDARVVYSLLATITLEARKIAADIRAPDSDAPHEEALAAQAALEIAVDRVLSAYGAPGLEAGEEVPVDGDGDDEPVAH